MALLLYLALAAYTFLGFAVAWAARKGMGRGLADFFLANRTLGGAVNALSYSATTYSAFMMVGLAGLTYRAGVGALGFELVYLSGLVLAAFFGPRFWFAAKLRGYVSPAEMLGDRYESRAVTLVAAGTSLLFLIPYTSVQLMGIAYLLQELSQGAVPYVAGVLWATFLALAWARVGGLRSVAWTDAFQALVMLVSSGLVVFFAVRGIGGIAAFFHGLEQNYSQWLAVPGPGFFQFSTFLGLAPPLVLLLPFQPSGEPAPFCPAFSFGATPHAPGISGLWLCLYADFDHLGILCAPFASGPSPSRFGHPHPFGFSDCSPGLGNPRHAWDRFCGHFYHGFRSSYPFLHVCARHLWGAAPRGFRGPPTGGGEMDHSRHFRSGPGFLPLPAGPYCGSCRFPPRQPCWC